MICAYGSTENFPFGYVTQHVEQLNLINRLEIRVIRE
jgi:hypothetical protein